jgi:hypothetical protein
MFLPSLDRSIQHWITQIVNVVASESVNTELLKAGCRVQGVAVYQVKGFTVFHGLDVKVPRSNTNRMNEDDNAHAIKRRVER